MTDQQEFSLGTVRVALTPLERFREFLDSRGKRLTQQRQMILERILERHDHFEADELVESISYASSTKRVSRPTVYRTLNELFTAGLLRKMNVGGRTVYEHDYGYPQHDHLYCEKCGSLIEFSSDEIKELRSRVAARYSFWVNTHRFVIQGVCKECRVGRAKRPVDLI